MTGFKWQLLLLLVVVILANANKRTSDSIAGEHCNTTDGSRCCFDFYLKDGKCKECENGTHKPSDKDHCIKCEDNSYGKRCGQECNCLSNQICDNVVGCINNQSGSERKESLGSSFEVVVPVLVCVFVLIILLFLYLKFYKRRCGSIKGVHCRLSRRTTTQKESQNDEDPYSEIRESEMIKDLNSNDASYDIETPGDGYNHLRVNGKYKKMNSNNYNEKVYFKLEKMMATTDEKTTDPNYDKMGNISSLK